MTKPRHDRPFSRHADHVLALCAVATIVGCTNTTHTDDHVYGAMVRGPLRTANPADSQDAADVIVTYTAATAKAKGDIAHDVMLGTTLLDSIAGEYFAFDQWTDVTAMRAFYADAQLAQAYGELFASPPTVTLFELHPEWTSWGDLSSGRDLSARYFHLALGHLANPNLAADQQAHDQVASAGEAPSMAAGNLAHVVFLGLDDPTLFNAIDIWGASDNIQAFYTNPQFVMAFAPLFSDVTQPVYASTDWAQW